MNKYKFYDLTDRANLKEQMELLVIRSRRPRLKFLKGFESTYCRMLRSGKVTMQSLDKLYSLGIDVKQIIGKQDYDKLYGGIIRVVKAPKIKS